MSKWLTSPLNIVTDSLYVAGIVERIEEAQVKDLQKRRLAELMRQLQTAIRIRSAPYCIIHLRSHQWDIGLGEDVAEGDGYPASRLGSRADALGDRMGMSTGRAFPASGLDPALELTWHRRGPQRVKYKAETGKSSQRSSEVLKQILKELDKAAHELDGETVEKEAPQEGGSHAVPISDDKRGAIQSTGMPGVKYGNVRVR
ncbi:uncharacterized protein RDI95_015310 [Morus bassanus]